MKVCLECDKRISLVERIKSTFKNSAQLQCDNCKSLFIREKKSGRVIFSIGSGLAVFISMIIGFEVLPTIIESSLLRSLVIGLMAGGLTMILAIILTYFTEYEKVEQ